MSASTLITQHKNKMRYLYACFILIAASIITSYFYQQRSPVILETEYDYEELHPGKVILYTAEWCSPCKIVKDFLNKHNIPYHEYDIDKSKFGKAQLISLGTSGIPTVLINKKVIVGINNELILEEYQKKKNTNTTP